MKMRKEHRVPLASQVINLLYNLKQISGKCEYLFPQQKDQTKPVNSQTINQVLKRHGYKDKLVSHGFRAMASSYFYENSYQSSVIEACLAHVCGNKTVQAYNRSDFFKSRIKLMNDWANLIEQYYDCAEKLPKIMHRSDDQ